MHSRIIFSLACLFFCLVLSADVPKPTILTGTSYGTHEVRRLINTAIAIGEDETYIYRNFEGEIPYDELDKYSLLIVAFAVKTPATAAEMKKLRSWVEKGGGLILMSAVPYSLCGGAAEFRRDKALAWTGITGMMVFRNGGECGIVQPGSAILKGITYDWSEKVTRMVTVAPPMKAVIGQGDQALIGMAEVGKGKVFYFGAELFRLRQAKSPMADPYLEAIRNAIRIVGPLDQSKMQDAQLDKINYGDRKVLFWDREWDRGEQYGPRFTPPLPAIAELITVLKANMAQGEYESVQLNITPLAGQTSASCVLESATIPAENLEFLVQAKPDPIPWNRKGIVKEFPYWMMPPEYVEPKGRPEFNLPADSGTQVVWLRVNSRDLASGDHVVKMNFTFSDGQKATVPVELKVYPVKLPRQRLIKLAAAGQVYGSMHDVPAALRFAKDLESHGIEWSLIASIRPDKMKLRGSDETLNTKTLLRLKSDFEAGKFPELDFALFDPWMDQCLAHGLTLFRADPLQFFTLAKLDFSDELKQKVRGWFAGEVSRYVREKGVDMLITSKGDELSIKELRESWVPWAKEMSSYGWDCTSTFSSGVNVELFNEISPLVRLWTHNQRYATAFAEKVKSGEIKIRPDAMIGSYGAGEGRGTEFRKPLHRSRYLGWYSWLNGLQTCAVNPYFKGWLYYTGESDRGEAGGTGGERFVSYIVMNDYSVPIADCPFWEGVRDGLEEGNLCAILAWYLDYFEKNGQAAKARAIRAKLDKIIGSDEDAILTWNETEIQGYSRKVIKPAWDDYKKAKKALLELMVSIGPDARKYAKPSLRWNQVELVREGKIVAAVYYDRVRPDALLTEVKKHTGLELPAIQGAAALKSEYPVAIVVGSGTQNGLGKELLAKHNSPEPNDFYPKNGNYFIRRLPDNILVIAGPDEAGTGKGVEYFCKFFEPRGFWL